MTTIPETRHTQGGTAYLVHTPIHMASDKAFDNWFAGQLREYLFRKGCKVEHLPDETLLMQTRNTFQTTAARDGITVAVPVESKQSTPTSSQQEEPSL